MPDNLPLPPDLMLMMDCLRKGNPAFMPSPPPAIMNDLTVSVSTSPKITIEETTKIAVSAAGIFLVILGIKYHNSHC